MLGETIREARIRKNLTQARLAKLAGVSRRHLAALEKGANVSVSILQRVAQVLELKEIQLGDLALKSGQGEHTINYPLATDTIREARVEVDRFSAIVSRFENILGSGGKGGEPGVHSAFPMLPPYQAGAQLAASGEHVHERPDWTQIEVAGELRHGLPIDETRKEQIAIPKSLVDEGEIVLRARGDSMHDQGIADGDLLIVELRPRGKASTGELVIGRVGKHVFVGRWWQKHGMKALMSQGMAEVTVGRHPRSLRVVAAINQIVKL